MTIEVIGAATTIRPTVTVTAGAYHANDNIGGVLTLSNAMRVTDESSTLVSLTVLDAANQKAQLEFLFFNANPSASTFTNNAAPVIHADDVAKFCGRVTLYASDYLTVGAKAVANLNNLGLTMRASNSMNLYLALLTPGTPTYAATSDLSLSLVFYQS